MLLLPEEYVLLSILKSLYGLFLEGACRPVIGPQGVCKFRSTGVPIPLTAA